MQRDAQTEKQRNSDGVERKGGSGGAGGRKGGGRRGRRETERQRDRERATERQRDSETARRKGTVGVGGRSTCFAVRPPYEATRSVFSSAMGTRPRIPRCGDAVVMKDTGSSPATSPAWYEGVGMWVWVGVWFVCGYWPSLSSGSPHLPLEEGKGKKTQIPIIA